MSAAESITGTVCPLLCPLRGGGCRFGAVRLRSAPPAVFFGFVSRKWTALGAREHAGCPWKILRSRTGPMLPRRLGQIGARSRRFASTAPSAGVAAPG